MTTIITGTSQGLGKELARQWQSASLIELNRTTVGSPDEITVDFADGSSVEKVKNALTARIDIDKEILFILNAAAYGNDEKIAEVTPQLLGTIMYTNVFSQLSLVEHLLEKGMKVKLIAISSSMASIDLAADPTHFAYSTSKAALNLAVRLLQRAHPLLEYLIVDPGWMKTRMGGSDAPDDPAHTAMNIFELAQESHNWNLSDGMIEANSRKIVKW